MKKISKSVMISLIIMIMISLLCLLKIEIGGERLQLASFTLIIGIVAFFVTRKTNEDKDEGLNHKTILSSLKSKSMILWILMPMIMNVISLLIAKLFVPEFVEHLTARTDFLAFNMIPVLIVELVIAALGEEIAWRAFFQKQISKSLPFVPSLIVSSALFSICHFYQGSAIVVIYDLVFIFINAMIYGIIFKKTDNAFISTIAHFLANLFGTISIMFL
ncbi:MAG: CPBP family intramembrane glutamic endopeptidase [Acutalibacteraceae bacterium]|nr:CPBP family intramembrane glutamic endopeptidase [Acutalibacteraceae bacterium]